MHKQTTRHLRPALAHCAGLALLMLAGCTPGHVRWMGTLPPILPQPATAETHQQPRGYLVIELPQTIGPPGDAEPQHFLPVYVYDRQGHYVKRLWNDTEDPTPLPPGDYIVLVGETDPMGEFHQVQVHVAAGHTTAVSVADVDRAPAFWELLRTLEN